MSHLVKIELEINDLSVLKKTCQRLGLKFMQDQKQYTWFGQWVGDSPMPEGVKLEDLGKCDHAIKVPGCKYEIGVVKKNNTYGLIWDYWYTGGLEEKIGKGGGLLKQGYAIEKAKMEATKKGYSVRELRTQTGVQLRIQVR